MLGGYPPGVYACGPKDGHHAMVALKTTKIDDAERTLDDYKKGPSLLLGTLELEKWGAVVFTMHAVDCTKATSLDDREVCEKYGK